MPGYFNSDGEPISKMEFYARSNGSWDKIKKVIKEFETPPEFAVDTVDIPAIIRDPSHYKTDGREVIEFIKEMGWFKQYALGNIMKYLCRCEKKDQYKEDLQKIMVYAKMLLEDEKE